MDLLVYVFARSVLILRTCTWRFCLFVITAYMVLGLCTVLGSASYSTRLKHGQRFDDTRMFCVLYSHDGRIDNKPVLSGQQVLLFEIVV